MNTNKSASRQVGFTVIEIMILLAILGLLCAIAIPNFKKARENSLANVCNANLKKLHESTKDYYKARSRPTQVKDQTAEAYVASALSGWPACPLGGLYTLGDGNKPPTCSYGHKHEITTE